MGVHAGHDGPYNTCPEQNCAAHRAAYQKRWRLDRSRGVTRLVDAEPARLRIAALTGAGWSLRAIAGHAGLTTTTVSRVAHGQDRVAAITSRAILAVNPARLPAWTAPSVTKGDDAEPFVPRIGTVRRIQALMAIGYSHVNLKAAGIDSTNLLHQRGRWVTRTTHDRVATIYRRLMLTPGPTPRAAREAAKRGFAGPLAWRDIDLDAEPNEREPVELDDTVDEAVVDRILAGQAVSANAAERAAVVERWPATGRSFAELGRLTGWKVERYSRRDAA